MGKGNLLKNRAVVSLALFVLALALRFDGIAQHDLQPDEQHWTMRSSQLLVNLRDRPTKATNHLGHPGVTPVIVMAFGQKMAKVWNRLLHREPGTRWYVDRLLASRLAAATLSALTIPLLYLLAAWLIGSSAALWGAALLACDPTHIGFSRLAQLDTVQTTVVLACVATYLYAVQTARLDLKLLAGVLWGLSIVTKPTAASLVAFFFVYRLFRMLIPRAARIGEKTLLSWSDVAAIMVGQITFAALFTRMWNHNSDYRLRLGIHSPAADFLYDLGTFFQENVLIFCAFLYVLLYIIYRLRKQQQSSSSNLLRHLVIIFGTAVVCLIALTIIPQVFENLTRFWGWVGNLSHMKHASSHQVWDTSDYGYLQHFFIRLPEVTLLGILMACISLAAAISRFKADEKQISLLAQIALVIIWTLPLSTSGKQTWRYVLPVLPAIYLLAGYGFSEAAKWLKDLKLSPAMIRITRLSTPLVIFSYQIWGVIDFRPYLETYINRISVDFTAEFRRAYGLASIGDTKALRLLYKEAQKAGHRIFISTTKDASLLQFSARRLFPEKSELLMFGYYPSTVADYLLINPQQWQMTIENSWPILDSVEPLLQVSFRDMDLLHLYAVPEHSWHKPTTLFASRSQRTTGKIVESKEEKVLYAKLRRDKIGVLMMGEGLRLIPGNYQIQLRAWIPERSLHKPRFTNDQRAITLRFGRYCSWDLRAHDLLHPRDTVMTFSCAVTSRSRVDPSVTWHGLVPVMVHSIEVGLESN